MDLSLHCSNSLSICLCLAMDCTVTYNFKYSYLDYFCHCCDVRTFWTLLLAWTLLTLFSRPPGVSGAYGYLFLRSTFFFIGWLVGLGPKFLDNGSQPSLSGSPQNLHTSLVWGQVRKPTCESCLTPPLKIWRGNLKFRQTFTDPPSIGSA